MKNQSYRIEGYKTINGKKTLVSYSQGLSEHHAELLFKIYQNNGYDSVAMFIQ